MSSQSPTTPIQDKAAKMPLHLSEFYSFVNNNTTNGHVLEPALTPVANASTNSSYGRSPTTRNSVSSSSNFSSYTNDQSPDQMVLSLRDMLKVASKYEKMVVQLQKYLRLLQELSQLSGELGASIEELGRMPGTEFVENDLYNSSGIQFVNANYESILSQLVVDKLVEPVGQLLKRFKKDQKLHDSSFQDELKVKLQNLKKKEQNLNHFNRLKNRNLMLNTYKENLISLTMQLDEIETFKKQNYHDLMADLHLLHSKILLYLSGVIRSQLEINESILRKSWSGGGLELLISKCPDPFSGGEDLDLDDLDPASDHVVSAAASLSIASEGSAQDPALPGSDIDNAEDYTLNGNEASNGSVDGDTTANGLASLTPHLSNEWQSHDSVPIDNGNGPVPADDSDHDDEGNDTSFSLPIIPDN